MVTGDQPVTAEAIARQIGILRPAKVLGDTTQTDSQTDVQTPSAPAMHFLFFFKVLVWPGLQVNSTNRHHSYQSPNHPGIVLPENPSNRHGPRNHPLVIIRSQPLLCQGGGAKYKREKGRQFYDLQSEAHTPCHSSVMMTRQECTAGFFPTQKTVRGQGGSEA